jgi:23S rRNA (cytosine1962-C5)-methyltransferase
VNIPIIQLQLNRQKRVLAGHPWIYSNEVAMDAAAKALPMGGLVQFQTSNGKNIGVGSFHPHNLICGRIYSRDNAVIDQAWFSGRLRLALALREKLFSQPYYRLVHAEADGLPGLIVDRYGDHLIVQINSAGMAVQQETVIAALDALLRPQTIILRNDASARLLEGLQQEVVVAKGVMPDQIELQENGLRFVADLAEGQKTGWFYDQRMNRALVAGLCRDAKVLDVYCHTGAFALNAAAAGAASVVGVDASELALTCAAEAARRNGLAEKASWQRGEAYAVLADYAEKREKFDVVICDPPAFIKSRKDVGAGTRGYRKLVRLAAGLVQRGGYFFIASCSHHMELASFAEQIAGGIADAGREGQVLHTVFAAPDHPVHPHLPESAYLKGQLLRIL